MYSNQSLAQFERGEDVSSNVELSRDVGAAESELVGGVEEASQGVRRVENDVGIYIRGANSAAVPTVDVNWKVLTQESVDKGPDGLSNRCLHTPGKRQTRRGHS